MVRIGGKGMIFKIVICFLLYLILENVCEARNNINSNTEAIYHFMELFKEKEIRK